MKTPEKVFTIAIALFVLTGCTSKYKEKANNESQENMVFVCSGPSSKRYHAVMDCRGLSGCSGIVEQMTADEAGELGKTPCKICYQ